MDRLPIRKADKKLITSLVEEGVEFLIVGGVAAANYGARDSFDVDDMDVLVNPTIENGKRLIKSLRSLGIQISFTEVELTGKKKQMPLKFGTYYTDILTAESESDFARLGTGAIETKVDAVDVLVIGKNDLIRMKEEIVGAGKDHDRKHAADIDKLRSDDER